MEPTPPMSPAPSILQQIVCALFRRLVLLLDGFLGAREAWMRPRLAALPEGHKRRAGLAAELARAERARAVLADPDNHDAPWFRGLVAEVARVRNDAGRRALARRRIYPNIFFRLPVARPAPGATTHPPEERCTTSIVVA